MQDTQTFSFFDNISNKRKPCTFFFRNKHTYTKEREMSSKKNRTLSKKKTLT